MNSLSATAGNYVTKGIELDQAQRSRATVGVAGSAAGTGLTNIVETLTAQWGQLESQTTGKPPQQRQALAGSLLARVKSQIATIKGYANNGNAGLADFRQGVLTDLQGLENQIQSIITPTSKETKGAARIAERAQRKLNQNNRFVDESTLKSDDLDITGDLKDLGKAKTQDGFDAARSSVQAALVKWTEDQGKLAEQEIVTKGLNGPQADNYRREIAATVQEKQETVARAIGDAYDKMVEAQVAAIERAYKRSIAPAEQRLAAAQGQLSGLDRASLNGINSSVPDYVKQLASRRVAEAQEALDAGQLKALPIEITSLQQELDSVQKTQDDLEAKIKAGGPDVMTNRVLAGQNRETIDKVKGTIDQKTTQLGGLQSTASAGSQIPSTFGGSFNAAVTAFQTANHTGEDIKKMFEDELPNAISSTQSAFTSFFDDIFTGTKSALGAIEDMARGVIKSLEQIAAEVVAKKLFGLLLGAVSGGTGTSTDAAGAARGGTFVGPPGDFNGGLIGYDSGGLVTTGLRSKDSVPTILARGEFVLRNKAVDSLGTTFLSKLNQSGAGALDALKQVPVIGSKPSHLETNVYVVPPDQKPSLGPNDVLLVVSDDIVKGGTVKQLIKHVAQGG